MENWFFFHSAFSTLRIFYTPHFPHSALSTLRIFYTPHFPHSAFSTLRIFYTPHFPHSAFSTLRTPHSALRTPHSALRTPHSALRTPHIPPNPKSMYSNFLNTLNTRHKFIFRFWESNHISLSSLNQNYRVAIIKLWILAPLANEIYSSVGGRSKGLLSSRLPCPLILVTPFPPPPPLGLPHYLSASFL